jgi:hypothetical protein
VPSLPPGQPSCRWTTCPRTDNRGRYAIGAVHKLNGLDGAQYLLENRAPFGIGVTGRSTIKIAKDRPAQLRKAAVPSGGGLHWYGDLVLTSHAEEFAEVSIEPPHQRDENWRPTFLMERVATFLAEQEAEHIPVKSRRMVRTGVQGNEQAVLAALDFLILDGFVSDTAPYKLRRPYPT